MIPHVTQITKGLKVAHLRNNGAENMSRKQLMGYNPVDVTSVV